MRAAAAWRVALLRRFVEPGELVEIGAGAGAFATAAMAEGFAATAVEMNRECCAFLARAGARAICTDRPLDALAGAPRARVVAMWHVLEHLRDPALVLAAAAERLEPGGILVLAVPNPASLQLRLLGTRWAHLDAPRHLCLSPAEALIRASGLEPAFLTTSDPDGRACDLHGWVYALHPRPAAGPPPPAALHGGGLITRVLSPLERRRGRGAALTLVLRK
jgi:SAM-dependent methyltransferase